MALTQPEPGRGDFGAVGESFELGPDHILGDPAGPVRESFTAGRLDFPQYTRPAEFRGLAVPSVLLSGDHGQIARWRRREALRRTAAQRPELLTTQPPSAEERGWLREFTEGVGTPPPSD